MSTVFCYSITRDISLDLHASSNISLPETSLHHYIEPYRILKAVSPVTYLVEPLRTTPDDPFRGKQTPHVSRIIKPYVESSRQGSNTIKPSSLSFKTPTLLQYIHIQGVSAKANWNVFFLNKLRHSSSCWAAYCNIATSRVSSALFTASASRSLRFTAN